MVLGLGLGLEATRRIPLIQPVKLGCLQAAPTIVFFKVRDFELQWEFRLWKATEVPELVGVEVCALHLTKYFL